jgi:hypothetical protein
MLLLLLMLQLSLLLTGPLVRLARLGNGVRLVMEQAEVLWRTEGPTSPSGRLIHFTL